jgi:hypothetical protein
VGSARLRVAIARAILPAWCVVIFREDLDEAAELAETCYGRVPVAVNWARVHSCLNRAEWRCLGSKWLRRPGAAPQQEGQAPRKEEHDD